MEGVYSSPMRRPVRQLLLVLLSALIALGTPLSHSTPDDSEAPCEASMAGSGMPAGDCCGDTDPSKCATRCALAAAGTVLAASTGSRLWATSSYSPTAQAFDARFQSRASPPGLQPPR